MKKILSVAIVALTMVFLSSCGGGGSYQYEQGDPMPSINASKGTVNGHSYDTSKNCCWKVTFNYTIQSNGSKTKGSEVTYEWGTEFEIVSVHEMAMWTYAQAGKYAAASYSYVKTSESTYEDCVNRNKE